MKYDKRQATNVTVIAVKLRRDVDLFRDYENVLRKICFGGIVVISFELAKLLASEVFWRSVELKR